MPTVSSSQTTYPKQLSDSTIVITKDQLKQANLLFLERDKLILENQQLNDLVVSYDDLISNMEKTDSLKNEQIVTLMNGLKDSEIEIKDNYLKIDKLTNKNKWYKGLTIGGFTISATLLILLLVK